MADDEGRVKLIQKSAFSEREAAACRKGRNPWFLQFDMGARPGAGKEFCSACGNQINPLYHYLRDGQKVCWECFSGGNK